MIIPTISLNGTQIQTDNLTLLSGQKPTFLTSDTASGVGTLTVKNIFGYAVNQYLLIGVFGNEGAEIIKTHASTVPTGSTITLAANTSFPHSAGTPITIIPYNVVEIRTATTATGSKTLLGTTAIAAVSIQTKYDDTAASTGFYFTRFKNENQATFSDYTGAVPTTGYTRLMARSIIDAAKDAINETNNSIFPDSFCFKELDNCQIEVLRELKRWSFMQEFSYVVGNTSYGTWKVALPTNCDDQHTTKSIWNFRIGTQPDMIWVDKAKFNELTYNIANSQVTTTTLSGLSFIVLDDTSDFDDSGDATIGGWAVPYTANDRTLNKLTLTSTLTTTAVAGADVFQGASLGVPRYWTTHGGYVYHYPVTGHQLRNNNYYLDYYKNITSITSDVTEISFPDPLVAQYYLQWKMILKKNNGVESEGSIAAFGQYSRRLQKMKQKETENRVFQLRPRFNNWSKQMSSNVDGNFSERTGNFENIR